MVKNYLDRLWSKLRQDPLLTTLLVLTAAYFFLYYLTDPARPANIFNGWLGYQDKALYPLGWFGYFDQGQYLRLAHTLANFDFSELHKTYSYGIGYPLVAVPFIWLGFNSDPFVFFNFATFLFAAYAIYRTAKQLISPFAGFIAGFGLVFATPLIHYVDQPWNSTVCLLTMSAILVALTVKKVKKWHVLVLGILLGWAFAARYVDILWLGILALAAIYRGPFKTLAKQTILLAIGASLLIAPVLYSQYKVFGSPFRTPYVNHIGLGGKGGSDQGLAAYSTKRIPNASLALLISPRLAGSKDNDRGLFIDMFWALLAIPGAVILWRRKNHRLFVGCFVAMTIAASLFYLSFRASTADSLKFGELHYFKTLWPGLVLLAAAYLDHLFKLSSRKR